MTQQTRGRRPEYKLTELCEHDLEEIARYTIETWGVDQAKRYQAALEAHFKAIGRGQAQGRVFLNHLPTLISTRCELHVIFSIQREGTCPLIIAVLHERMDLISRLQDRLDRGDDSASS